VRQKAADSLEKIVTRDAIEQLLAFLQQETDEYVRTVIVYLLGEIGGKNLSSTLHMFGNRGGDEFKSAIQAAIGKLQQRNM
jgi:HEAT repeat protein